MRLGLSTEQKLILLFSLRETANRIRDDWVLELDNNKERDYKSYENHIYRIENLMHIIIEDDNGIP